MAGAIKKLDDFEKQTLVSMDDDNQSINEKIDWCKKSGETKYGEVKKRIEQHNDFFDGKQIKYQIPSYKSDSVFNYIFPGVVNVVGLLTDATFEPQVHPLPSDDEEVFEENKLKAQGFERALRCLWLSRHIPEKMTSALYHFVIDEDVIFVPKWNYSEDDVDVEVNPITSWRFDPKSSSVEDSSWAIREMDKSWDYFVKNYPDKLDEIREAVKKKGPSSISEGKFCIEEYFTDEVYIMRIADIILKKQVNPYFEFRDEDTQRNAHEEQGNTGAPFQKISNFFKNPKKPVIQLSAYNSGELYSRSRMQQLLKPQVDLNKRMQQIDDNLVLGASGIWIYDTGFISEGEMNKVTFAPFQKIGVMGGKNSLHRESGTGLPPGMVDNVMQIQRGFDDIFGYHEISRGQKVRTQTFGESALLKEADQTSIRLLSRSYQAALERLVQYWTQLMSLFYTTKHYFQWLDETGANQFIALTRQDIAPGMHISVKVGAQLSKDKADQREEVSMLAQAGRIDPLTLFETLDYPNPKKLANRLSNWTKYGVISDEQMPAQGVPGQPGQVGPAPANEQVLRQQAALAAQENERMAAGEPIHVNPDDVVEIHMEIHQAFPNRNKLLQAHILEHQETGGGSPEGTVSPTGETPIQ